MSCVLPARGRYRAAIWTFTTVVGLAASAAALFWVAPMVIRAAYRGESLPWLNALIVGQAHLPVEHYLEVWRRLSFQILAGEIVVIVLFNLLSSAFLQGLVDRLFGPAPAHLATAAGAGMGKGQLILASAVVLGLVGAQITDIILAREDWPFSSYPMYSGQQRETIAWVRVHGVTSEGEIPLVPERHLRPYDTARVHYAIEGVVLRHPDQPAARERALRTFHGLYEAGRLAGEHSGPRLHALRLYRERWRIDPSLANRPVPDERVLIHELRIPG